MDIKEKNDFETVKPELGMADCFNVSGACVPLVAGDA